MMDNDTSKTSKNKALSKPKIFKEFVEWMSRPEPLRELKTQGDFSKKFNVSEKTLSTWKQRDDFWKAVEVEWRQWGKIKTSNVMAKFYTKVMGKGTTTADFKLWLQYFLDWSEKIEGKIDHGGKLEIVQTYPKVKNGKKD